MAIAFISVIIIIIILSHNFLPLFKVLLPRNNPISLPPPPSPPSQEISTSHPEPIAMQACDAAPPILEAKGRRNVYVAVSYLILSYLVLSYPILSYPILFHSCLLLLVRIVTRNIYMQLTASTRFVLEGEKAKASKQSINHAIMQRKSLCCIRYDPSEHPGENSAWLVCMVLGLGA